MFIPDIPKIYYVHCPKCDVVHELLKSDFEELDDNIYSMDCKCGLSQVIPDELLPTDERSAYKVTIANLMNMNQSGQAAYMNMQQAYTEKIAAIISNQKKLKLGNSMVNTLVFSLEKSARDILKALGESDVEEMSEEEKHEAVKLARYEANDLLSFILKEQDKATKDEKEIDKKKTGGDHWKKFRASELFDQEEV